LDSWILPLERNFYQLLLSFYSLWVLSFAFYCLRSFALPFKILTVVNYQYVKAIIMPKNTQNAQFGVILLNKTVKSKNEARWVKKLGYNGPMIKQIYKKPFFACVFCVIYSAVSFAIALFGN
jgi:hypothetical protein